MDGILIDSEPLWKIAEIEAFAKVGLNTKETDFEESVGLRIDEVVKLWHTKVKWTSKTVKEVEDDIELELEDVVIAEESVVEVSEPIEVEISDFQNEMFDKEDVESEFLADEELNEDEFKADERNDAGMDISLQESTKGNPMVGDN